MEEKQKNELESADVLKLLNPKTFDIRNFHQNFQDNSENALMQLLSVQDNDQPLKKGGEEIAFRCDILIMLNRQKYNAYENTLFDILCGYVSSRPQDSHYVIYPKDVKKLVNYTDSSYIYKLLKEATESIKNKPLIFQITLANGNKQNIAANWYDLLTYSDKETNDEASFISFTPTKFFKMLLISATVTHGAFYRIGVSSSIQSKYIRNLYYILESRKSYKVSPVAKPGKFRISIEDLQVLIGFPENYRSTDIRRTILEAAREEINAIEECDFTFDYKMIKTAAGAERKKYTHIDFMISDKDKKSILIEKKEENDDPVLKSMLMAVSMTEKERENVIRKYKEYHRDITFLTQAVARVLNSPSVRSNAAVLMHIMEHGLSSNVPAKTKDRYTKIEQHDYDFDELEKLLINNNPQ